MAGNMQRGSGLTKRTKQGAMDRFLFLLVLALSFFGVLMVFSASAPYALKQFGDAKYYFLRDLAFTILGVFAMWVVSHINYRIYRRFALALYIIALFTCVLVWVPGIAYPVNQAHRWIHLGPVTYMPSDGLKIASLILLTTLLTRKPPEKRGYLATLFAVMLFIGFTILPIYIQPNFSAVIVIAAVLLFVYFVYGMNLWHLFPMIGITLAGLAFAFWPREGNYRLERLLTVLDPMRDPTGSGWQLLQSLYAVASGGFKDAEHKVFFDFDHQTIRQFARKRCVLNSFHLTQALLPALRRKSENIAVHIAQRIHHFTIAEPLIPLHPNGLNAKYRGMRKYIGDNRHEEKESDQESHAFSAALLTYALLSTCRLFNTGLRRRL